MILSASRRTDIPAFYGEWFMNRLREGQVLSRNPMNPLQVSRILLSPDTVDCIVFWTKNPKPLMSYLSELEELGYRYYFQFTLTPYGRELEPGLPPKATLLETFRELSHRIGSEQVLWRYDPIVMNEEWSLARHEQAFATFCEELEGFTDCCTISFVDSYSKLRAVYKSGLLREITLEEMYELTSAFSRIAKQHGLDLFTCCEVLDLTSCGAVAGHCIDGERISRICGGRLSAKPDGGQRPGCGCVESLDIGSYDTCRHGCVYCYANRSAGMVAAVAERHDPNCELLTGPLKPSDRVTVRKMKSLLDRT